MRKIKDIKEIETALKEKMNIDSDYIRYSY